MYAENLVVFSDQIHNQLFYLYAILSGKDYNNKGTISIVKIKRNFHSLWYKYNM